MFVYFHEETHPRILSGIVRAFLPADPVILEGGAYQGAHGVALAQLWPTGQLHAFEPVPSLFEKAKKALEPFKNAHVYEMALSDEVGTATLHLSEGKGAADDASSSLFAPKETVKEFPHIAFKKELTVPTITIDQWAKDNKVDHVDLLYLDIQGAELSAMKGAPEIMKTVKVILTEVCFRELYDAAPGYEEIKTWLEGQGFRMIGGNFNPLSPLKSVHQRGVSGDTTYGDAIFVRESAIEDAKGRRTSRKAGK
jgi:FkbM family methyltransferase